MSELVDRPNQAATQVECVEKSWGTNDESGEWFVHANGYECLRVHLHAHLNILALVERTRKRFLSISIAPAVCLLVRLHFFPSKTIPYKFILCLPRSSQPFECCFLLFALHSLTSAKCRNALAANELAHKIQSVCTSEPANAPTTQ